MRSILLALMWIGLPVAAEPRPVPLPTIHITELPTRPETNHTAAFLDLVARHPPSDHPEPAYRFQAEVYAELAPYVRDRPGVMQVERIGTTVENRPIWAFHITHPTTPPDHTVLVSASIHALEWVGAEVATELAVRLAESPVPGVRVTIVPLLNVDGRARVEADLRAGENRYRRSNANGVDLNRDFAVNREAKAIWRHIIPRRYTTSPSPLSQPESRAIDALANRERFDVAVSLHAFGGYIYYPWAGLWERPPDHQRFVELGHVMQSGQGARAYRVQQLSHWAPGPTACSSCPTGPSSSAATAWSSTTSTRPTAPTPFSSSSPGRGCRCATRLTARWTSAGTTPATPSPTPTVVWARSSPWSTISPTNRPGGSGLHMDCAAEMPSESPPRLATARP